MPHERPRAARAGADEEIDVPPAEVAAVGGEEHAVVNRAVGEPRAFQLRDVDLRPELDEVRIDSDGVERDQRAAGDGEAALLFSGAEAMLAVGLALVHDGAAVAQPSGPFEDEGAAE